MNDGEPSMRAKVSYIVAVYNVAEYIEQCARSLFEQTLEDIEIVFVNDCSPDDSEEIIRRTLEEYPHRKGQVKILTHEKNKRIVETRKDGLSAASGEYINFIDGDDYVEPQMAELMYGKAVEKDADIVVCDIFWYERNSMRVVSLAPNGIVADGENVREDTINRKVMPNIWCKLIRRSLFVEHCIEWPVAAYAEDVVISYQIVYYARRIASVPVPLYHYRLNPNSISNNNSLERSEKKQQEFVQNNNVLFGFLEREGVSAKYAEGILAMKVRAKNEVLSYTNHRKCLRLWLRTYPEVNRLLFFGDKSHKSTYKEKLWMLAICMGLYPRLKHRLLSKRFKPDVIWRRGI
ncbi:MAG: glycosyltransferase family 2 protein [Bacteroidales bacterium]|nr:glycosyltransferase family 2 protein [Bacteroidales bacterium]